MKKQIPSINMFNKLKKAVFIAATFISSNSFAQNFEGKVTYEVSFPGLEVATEHEVSFPRLEVPAEQKAMVPTEMLMYCKGSNSRTELSMGMGMSQTIISNGKNKESIMLMDMMGNKTAIKFTEADEKKKAGEIIRDVKITEETKTIAGYKCKKAIVTLKEENIVMPIWFTEEINTYNSQWESMYKGIKGMIMEAEMKTNGMDMKMTAKSVNKEAVADSKFVVPEGYKQMTEDEFHKSLEFGQ
jgi:GLPGLI family protein